MNRWYIFVVFLVFVVSCSNQMQHTEITNVDRVNNSVRLASKDFTADVFEHTSDDKCVVDADVTFLNKHAVSQTVVGISSYLHSYIDHLKSDYNINADYTYKFRLGGVDIALIGDEELCNIIKKEWMHA